MKGTSRRLGRLEDRVGIKALAAAEAEARLRQQAHDRLLRRFLDLLEDALPAFGEADQERLAPQEGEGSELLARWPLRRWLDSVLEGSSRLPEGLAAATVQALLAAWLQPRVDSMCLVCLACSLCRPHFDSTGLPWK